VFDERFIRAARLQEFSAQQRLDDHTPAVRSRRPWPRSRSARQGLTLILLIVLAFSTAIYMGVRHPYERPAGQPAEPLRAAVVPLAPRGPVPGGSPAELFARSPASAFRTGSDGVTLPGARATSNFTESQVLAALDSAREYVVRSSITLEVLTGESVRPVRSLLDPAQADQFDRSLEHPAPDGRHAVTGWLIRFDPSRTVLADPGVRVRGSLTVTEMGPDRLEVVGDHILVYAVRAPDAGGQASLFTVRREIRLRFDRQDLRERRLEVVQTHVQAGPLSCTAETADRLRPLLAGQSAAPGGPPGTDPYAPDRRTAAVCGAMAPSAQPSP
jgi:hypothetical protein